MPIFQQGQYNTTALTVPGVYVQQFPPGLIINGVPTNIVGLVGTAAWGVLDTPILCSNNSDFGPQFGTVINRKYDLGTAIFLASQQGQAGVFAIVRVSDGTDTAASTTISTGGVAATGTVTFSANPTANDTLTLNGVLYTFTAENIGLTLGATLATLLVSLQNSGSGSLTVASYSLAGGVLSITYNTPGTGGNAYTMVKSSTAITLSAATLAGGSGSGGTGITLTAKHTGSMGNTITWFITPGSTPNTWCLIMQMQTYLTERFDNIAGSGNAFWVNLAAAINSGTNFGQGPSQLIVATAGSATAAPTQSSVVVDLTGGTDGVGSINSAALIGTNGSTPTGIYALMNVGCSAFVVHDLTDTTTFPTQLAFAANNATECFASTPSGDTVTGAVSTRNTLGLNNQSFHLMMGDFAYWFDSYNSVYRYNPMSTLMAGLRANLAPHLDTLNKPILGIIGTQRTESGQLPYSDAMIQTLATGGVDVVAQPPAYALQVGFVPRLGQTTSSDTVMRNDSYIQMMNYISRTFAAAFFSFVGDNQGFLDPDPTRSAAKAAADAFMTNLQSAGMIQAFFTQCDATLNPPPRVMAGYMVMNATVEFYGVVRYFLINLQGGVTVIIEETNADFQPIATTSSVAQAA